MSSLLLAVMCAVAYLVAYRTYGRYLGRRLFGLQDGNRPTPAVTRKDGVDFVPTQKEILFGHHYTSIAGTGPIVGPAIGVIWGWVPAILWVVFGSIFMGAIHDLGSLAVSLRHEGRSIGDIAGDLISPRVRIMFLVVIAVLLWIVIAVFCLVIATLFSLYPESVLSIWLEIPIAVGLGYVVYRKGKPALPYSLVALVLLYALIWLGTYVPLRMPAVAGFPPMAVWTVVLLIYAYMASSIPVWRLLQPRDYINGHELFVVMGVLSLALLVARPPIVAPAVQAAPAGAPPLWPLLFVTIACGAISGFHSLVASGTTSKQLSREAHALPIGYGGMVTEGMLAVLVIIAVTAGLGMAVSGREGPSGAAAWLARYAHWDGMQGLQATVGAFVEGAANLLSVLGIPLVLGQTVMGVFVASFAGTTLDTATRLQRYVVSELAGSLKIRPLQNVRGATVFAVVTAGALALWDGKGQGGMLLWPLFGAANQLLAALALLVVTVFLARARKPIGFTLVPLLFMLVMTGWAMALQIRAFAVAGNRLLLVLAVVIVLAEIWMLAESVLILVQARHGRIGPAGEAGLRGL